MNGDLESEIGFTQSRLHVNAVVRRVLVRPRGTPVAGTDSTSSGYINPTRNPTRRACACAGGGTGPTPNRARHSRAQRPWAWGGGRYGSAPGPGLPALFRAARRTPVSYLTEVRASDAPDLTKPLKPDR